MKYWIDAVLRKNIECIIFNSKFLEIAHLCGSLLQLCLNDFSDLKIKKT